MRLFAFVSLLTLVLLPGSALAQQEAAPLPVFVETFENNPIEDAALVLRGPALDRLSWNDDAPAFPGDSAGSWTAVYDARMPSGLAGWTLPQYFDETQPFTATSVFVIDSDEFQADPFGFFQISWGLWNSETTGLERTGTLENFAGDTFELVEFDYFPNVSPFFGGPFVGPSAFGVADPDNPLFDFLGSFINAGFGSVELELPLDEPLIAVLAHDPAANSVTSSVYRFGENGVPVLLPGSVSVAPLDGMGLRRYELDTVGLTLWRDGFSGESPTVFARVHYHRLEVRPGVLLPRASE